MLVGLAIQKWLVPDMQQESLQLLTEVLSVAIPTVLGLIYARSQVYTRQSVEEIIDAGNPREALEG